MMVMLHVFAGVFADGHLLIAVTHFDEYYRHSDEFSSVQEAKEVSKND